MTCIKTSTFCLFVLILISSCKTDNETEKVPEEPTFSYELELQDSFTIENSDEFSLDRVRNVPIINKDETKIAWINEDSWEIFITDMKGEFISSFGRSGRGPEEFQEIAAIGFDSEDNIIVFDVLQDQFKKFNIEGELIEIFGGTLDDDIWIRSRKLYVHDDKIYLSIQQSDKASDSNHWQSDTIAEYSLSDGSLIRTFGHFDPSLEGAGRLYNYVNMVYDAENRWLFTTHRTSYYVQVFDSENEEVIGRFGNQTENFSEAEDPAGMNDPMHVRHQKNLDQSFVGESFVSDEYFYLQHYRINEDVLRYSDPFHKTAFLSVYSKKDSFQFISEIELDYPPLFITSIGEIYLLKNNDPENFTVNVYEKTQVPL